MCYSTVWISGDHVILRPVMPRGSMWKIKRDDIFMRRGAGRDMGICPENASPSACSSEVS
jgi:hypothetical protein